MLGVYFRQDLTRARGCNEHSHFSRAVFPGKDPICASWGVPAPGLWHSREAALTGHIPGPALMELCPCWPLVSLVLPADPARPPNQHFPSLVAQRHGIFGSGKSSGITEPSLWLITPPSARQCHVQSSPEHSSCASLWYPLFLSFQQPENVVTDYPGAAKFPCKFFFTYVTIYRCYKQNLQQSFSNIPSRSQKLPNKSKL